MAQERFQFCRLAAYALRPTGWADKGGPNSTDIRAANSRRAWLARCARTPPGQALPAKPRAVAAWEAREARRAAGGAPARVHRDREFRQALPISIVLNEAGRADPEAYQHIEEPRAALLIAGVRPETLLPELQQLGAKARDALGRKLRRDSPLLVSIVCSHPFSMVELTQKVDRPLRAFERYIQASPAERARLEADGVPERWTRVAAWQDDVVAAARDKYGSAFRSCVGHTDEIHYHLHLQLLPQIDARGRVDVAALHEGIRYRAQAIARIAAEGRERRQGEIDAAWKAGLAAFRDDVFQRVSSRHGHRLQSDTPRPRQSARAYKATPDYRERSARAADERRRERWRAEREGTSGAAMVSPGPPSRAVTLATVLAAAPADLDWCAPPTTRRRKTDVDPAMAARAALLSEDEAIDAALGGWITEAEMRLAWIAGPIAKARLARQRAEDEARRRAEEAERRLAAAGRAVQEAQDRRALAEARAGEAEVAVGRLTRMLDEVMGWLRNTYGDAAARLARRIAQAPAGDAQPRPEPASRFALPPAEWVDACWALVDRARAAHREGANEQSGGRNRETRDRHDGGAGG